MSKVFKKMELKKVPFKKLLKLELPELTDNVVRILEKHDPKKLQIDRVFDLLVTELPSIKLLVTGYGVHPLAAELSEANDKLLLYVSAIKFQLRMAIKENEPDKQQYAVVVELAVNNYLHKLRSSKNYAVINRRVAQFLYETTADAELAHALKSLNIIEYLNKLQLALTSVWDLQERKLAIISQRPQETTKEISAPIIFALKNVFKQVELSRAIHPELDYTDLFNELNEVINEYRAKVSRREASNKRKAIKKKALETVGSIEQPDVSSDFKDSEASVEKIETDSLVATDKVIMEPQSENFVPEVIEPSSNAEFAHKLDIENISAKDTDKYFIQGFKKEKRDTNSSKHLQKPDLNGDT